MSIAFIKLFECTGDIRYRIAAEKIVEGLLRHHKSEHGFAMLVNIHTGEVLNASVKTKFVALFIKALHVLRVGGSIYENEQLFMLLKDR